MSQLQLNYLEVQTKLSSKRDLYLFLTQDCVAHLPSLKQTNSYFLSAILKGDRNYIRRDQVKVSAIPFLEDLTVANLLEMAQQNEDVMQFLPDQRDWRKIDRQWLGDILNTVIPDQLKERIDVALQKRTARQIEQRQLNVNMRPEFADALNRCMNIAAGNGRAVSTLKQSSKRRRTHEELEETKEEERLLRENKHEYMLQVKRLKSSSTQVPQQRQIPRMANSMSENRAHMGNQEGHPLQSQSLNKANFNI